MRVDSLTILMLVLVAAFGIWWSVARAVRSRTKVLPASTASLPPRVEPSPVDPARTLARAMEKMAEAERVLREVFAVGLWTKSDGCGDNRERRRGLRQAQSELADALDALTALSSAAADPPADLGPIRGEVERLMSAIETVHETVTDIMGDDLGFDSTVWNLYDDVAKVLQRTSRLDSERLGSAHAG